MTIKRKKSEASSVINVIGDSDTSKIRKKFSGEPQPIWKRPDGTIDWYLYDMYNTSEDDKLNSFSSGSYYGLY